MALLLGAAGVVMLPAAVELSRRSTRVSLLDAAYAVPLAFLLGIVSVGMARRARRNLRWLSLREGGTGVATVALLLGLLALCLALTAALSVGFYELILVYQHSR